MAQVVRAAGQQVRWHQGQSGVCLNQWI